MSRSRSHDNAGTLYLVATPIGNLSDISERAVETLRETDIIASEDTRVTRKLLNHFGIKKQLISYHAHNMQEADSKILARLRSGENVALVTDAGTPGISDPGEELVRLCTQNSIPVTVIPGPCAAVSALTLSGLPSARFVFEGFLPQIKSKRITRLTALKDETRTIIFYEAPHRLLKTLSDMLVVFGDRQISVSRELTKLFEETLRLTISDAVSHFKQNTPRGEFVFVVAGACEVNKTSDNFDAAKDMVKELTDNGASISEAIKEAARITGCSKNKLYKAVTTKTS